jgi:hypothetical protein
MTSNHRYFISEYADDYFFHGGIGIVDAERILKNNGFKPIKLPYQYSFSAWAKISRAWFCLKLIFSIDRKATIVFIHPLHATLNNWLARRLALSGRKVICMIGDINGLKDGDSLLLEKEVKQLKTFKNFIVHNQQMQDWLNKLIPRNESAAIDFFDFLAPVATSTRSKDDMVVFAGNLDKSKFLQDLGKLPLRFRIYGPGISHAMLEQPNVEYLGVIDPYELPGKLSGSFGLVWDGESTEEMKGSLGHYMQFISHHKISLYILAGLPIIIACNAGGAPLVNKHRIGICVNSLSEIPNRIHSLTAIEYEEMINNMKPLAREIAKGNCLSSALDRLLKRLD